MAEQSSAMSDMNEDTLTARNRINQRNFRARRQNYIKDLEEKIRKYESDGVQATIEIQTAARQVTEQNARLRNLLSARFGMGDHEIDMYLGGSGTGQAAATLTSLLQPAGLTMSAALSTSTTLAPKSISATDSSLSFQSIAPHPDQIRATNNNDHHQQQQQSTLSSSLMSPALALSSLHKMPSRRATHEINGHPLKKQRLEHSEQMSIHRLTGTSKPDAVMPDHDNGFIGHGQYRQGEFIEIEQDTQSESSNPHTPADIIDSALRIHTSLHNNNLRRSNTDGFVHTTAPTKPIAHFYPSQSALQSPEHSKFSTHFAHEFPDGPSNVFGRAHSQSISAHSTNSAYDYPVNHHTENGRTHSHSISNPYPHTYPHATHHNTYSQSSLHETSTCQNPHSTNNDEREDAARIIASLRGGSGEGHRNDNDNGKRNISFADISTDGQMDVDNEIGTTTTTSSFRQNNGKAGDGAERMLMSLVDAANGESKPKKTPKKKHGSKKSQDRKSVGSLGGGGGPVTTPSYQFVNGNGIYNGL